MKTDDLIEALAAGLEPASPAQPNPWFLAAAGAVAVAVVIVLLGVRGDLSTAMFSVSFWAKAAYTIAITVAALTLVTRLGQPGARVGRTGWALAIVVGIAGLMGLTELAMLPAQARMDDWLGFTWRVCAIYILLVSLFTAPLVFLAMRGLAPTRPMQAGAATGVVTGAIAATAYGLHCPEATAAFVATWYTLGIAGAGALGAVIGRFALRW